VNLLSSSYGRQLGRRIRKKNPGNSFLQLRHCLLFLAHCFSASRGSGKERSQDVEVSDTTVKIYVYMIANFTDYY
jgi:hypothetical protein